VPRPVIEWSWNRRSVTTVVVVMLSVAFTAFLIKFAQDHDGETVTLGGDPAGTSQTVETGDTDPESGLPWVREDELPVEGQATRALIDQGGPFPYDRDGAVFHNLEGILPTRDDGYYREYTVITPGSTDRGARRIVTGSGDEYFWTDDHYESFERILRRSP
jgi:ribonuclease T1